MLQLSQRALTASKADGDLFVDRRDELAGVERALSLGFSVYVVAPSGAGKTSLVRRLETRLAPPVAFVNAARLESVGDVVDMVATDPAIVGVDPFDDDDVRALDALAGLRSVVTPGHRPIVLLDGLEARLRHEMFGRQRDEMWEIPLRWVVTGDTSLAPPADTFFETTVALEPLDAGTMRELLLRRARTGSPDERSRLEDLADILPELLDPATPRHVLATARTLMLSSEPEVVLDQLRAQRNARTHLSDTAGRVLDAVGAFGPTHAGDPRLLDEIGTTRSRIVQVFRELEEAGLLVSERDGRRKLYGRGLGATL